MREFRRVCFSDLSPGHQAHQGKTLDSWVPPTLVATAWCLDPNQGVTHIVLKVDHAIAAMFRLIFATAVDRIALAELRMQGAPSPPPSRL